MCLSLWTLHTLQVSYNYSRNMAQQPALTSLKALQTSLGGLILYMCLFVAKMLTAAAVVNDDIWQSVI